LKKKYVFKPYTGGTFTKGKRMKDLMPEPFKKNAGGLAAKLENSFKAYLGI
jgi:hypothetical protein